MPNTPFNSSVDIIANALAGGLALASVLTPRFVEPCGIACGPMRCHWTFQATFLLAVATLVVAGSLWIVRDAAARRAVGGGLVIFGLLLIAVGQPWGIGLCGGSDMPCQRTAHWLWLWAALIVGVGVFIAIRARIPADKTVSPDPWEQPKEISKGVK